MASRNQIFKNGSKTFFYSTLFFPKNVKDEVATLYAFVRVADDYVDQVPPFKKEFYDFKDKYYLALKGEVSNNEVIDDFVKLQNKYNFDQAWIDAFIFAMESDLDEVLCVDLKQTKKYMYGSASVVGLMMSKILGLKEDSYIYADKLGQAFQYINFIRDISEDNDLNRQYLPKEHLKKFNLDNLKYNHIKENQENFMKFLRTEIDYFYKLINEAKPGFKFIPKRYRIPIEIAANLYLYTAKIIYKNPMIIFSKKVKPTKAKIFYKAFTIIARQVNYK